jgi:hypothetical protein
MRAENGGFIRHWKRPETVTANPEGNGIAYAFTKYPTELFSVESSTLTVKMTYSSQEKFSGFALINTNLTESASITMGFYPDSSFSTPDVEKNMSITDKTDKNIYIKFDELDYKDVQLYISDPSITTIEFGVIFPGEAYQFPHNFSWEYEEEYCMDKEVDTTDGGFHHETPDDDSTYSAPKYHKMLIKFKDSNGQYLNEYKKLIHPGQKIFVKSFVKPGCFFGIVPDKKLAAIKNRPGDTFSIRFFEHALIKPNNGGGGAQ